MELIARDLRHIWHPCSQMKDYEEFPPLPIVSATGSYFKLADGQVLIDAISSWWCKNLGHGHPQLKAALVSQAEIFEHVILANTTNETIVKLSECLTALTAHLKKVFYASEGSCAVEIAIKMSVHAQQILGQSQRTQVMALQNSYHGETGIALAVSDLGLYRKPYEALLKLYSFIENIPYVSSKSDPLWHDCSEQWKIIEQQLEPF